MLRIHRCPTVGTVPLVVGSATFPGLGYPDGFAWMLWPMGGSGIKTIASGQVGVSMVPALLRAHVWQMGREGSEYCKTCVERHSRWSCCAIRVNMDALGA